MSFHAYYIQQNVNTATESVLDTQKQPGAGYAHLEMLFMLISSFWLSFDLVSLLAWIKKSIPAHPCCAAHKLTFQQKA